MPFDNTLVEKMKNFSTKKMLKNVETRYFGGFETNDTLNFVREAITFRCFCRSIRHAISGYKMQLIL